LIPPEQIGSRQISLGPDRRRRDRNRRRRRRLIFRFFDLARANSRPPNGIRTAAFIHPAIELAPQIAVHRPRAMRGREEEVKRRARSGRRADGDMTAAGSHERSDLRHAESGAGLALGGEIGIEQVTGDLRRHAASLILDPNANATPRRRGVIAGRRLAFVGLDPNLAAVPHGVARVDDQVQDRRIESRRIDPACGKIGRQIENDANSGPGAIFEEALQPIEEIVDVRGMDFGFPGPGEQDELRRQPHAATDPLMRRGQGCLGLVRIVAIALGEVQPRLDDRENVPEIMGQARGHLAKRGDPLARSRASLRGRVTQGRRGRLTHHRDIVELGGGGRIALERRHDDPRDISSAGCHHP
jgi:hypothetical protein